MFSLTKEQVRYFRDNLQIEFEGVFKDEQITSALQALAQCKRKLLLAFEDKQMSKAEAKSLITSLPIELEPLRKLVLNKPIAELSKELAKAPSLRFGATCLITKETAPLIEELPVVCFSRDCSVRPIVCGWLLCLEEPTVASSSSIWSIHPSLPGSIRVFRGDLTIDLSQIAKSEGSYLLSLYTSKEGIAMKGEIDLWDPWLKDLGYAFGDRLRSVTHPLLAAP